VKTINVIEAVFFAALDKKNAGDRAAYLDQACVGDPDLRRCVEKLLNAQPKVGEFLQAPAAELPQTADAPADERAGIIIGPYKLLHEIGEGGMGTVWMAEQEQPVRRRVALKVIKPGMDSRQVLARFEAERQALALMDHPNIAKVLDAGATANNRPYFVMELVKGQPITEFCDKNCLTPRERLELFIPVCHAIQHAHQKGIIHRDIKPHNVLVALYDGKPVPKVIDFGVAKATAEPLTDKTLFTRHGQVVGTFEYMSPEQATLDQIDVDTRSDVYSLGVLLYELLTGTTPLEKERLRQAGLAEVLRLIREEEPPKPSTRLTSSPGLLAMAAAQRKTESQRLPKVVRGELDWIVMKALEKDRDRRFVTPNGLARDIERYLKGEEVTACPPTRTYRFRKWAGKHKVAFATTSAIAAALVAGISLTTWQAVRATNAERIASDNEEAARAAETVARAATAEAIHDRDTAATANDKLERTMQLQRKTRYAAEMNLVQAAFNAKDMPQVKKLLLAQVPKPGEPDDRGAEWHYWDRRLNGFVKEISLPALPPIAMRANAAFSPEGRRLANSILYFDIEPGKGTFRSMKVLAQIWDVETGQLAKQREWDLVADLNVPGGDTFSGAATPSIEFVNGGREVMIGALINARPFNGETNGCIREFVWNPETNESKPLFAREFEQRVDRTFITAAPTTAYTDDLSLQARIVFDPDADKRVLEVVRLADQKVLLRKVATNLRIGRVSLSPDGKYLIAGVGDLGPVGPARRVPTNLRTALWKIGGGDDPLWQRADEEPQLGFGDNPLLARKFVFSADGKTYSDFRYRAMGLTVDTFDLETGKLVQSRALVDGDGAARGPFAGFSLSARSMAAATDTRNGWIAVPSATGVAVRRLDPPTRTTAEATVDYESLDGPPLLIAFRPDGSLVTLHQDGGGFDESSLASKLRFWPKPAYVPIETTTWSGAVRPIVNRDRTHAAFLVAELPTRVGPQTLASRFKPLRLVVVDHTGAKLLDVTSTDRQTLSALEMDSDTFGIVRLSDTSRVARFSADGRYITYCVRTPSRQDPPDAAEAFDEVVTFDLQEKREVARLRLETGLELVHIRFSLDDSRLLVAAGVRTPQKDPDPFDPRRGTDMQVHSARLYEFPAGRPISDLKLPADKAVAGFRVTPQGWEGYAARGIRAAEASFHRWELASGEYLGEMKVERPQARPAERPPARQEISREERGGRVVRRFRTFRDERGFGEGMTAEVWDTARQGTGDRPLFTIEETETFQALLSPDGKRLLVSQLQSGLPRRAARPWTLYCTDTGRPVLSLPALGTIPIRALPISFGFETLGIWSADGRQFWATVDREGNLLGADFRPREPVKK